MSTNWASKTKTALAAIPASKPTNEAAYTVGARIESATPINYKTGSFGVKFVYKRDDNGKLAYENTVLIAKDGQPAKFGAEKFASRLRAAGLTSDEITAFPTPKDEHDTRDLARLVGSPVVLKLVPELYMGKTRDEVKAVYPAEGN